MRPLHQIITALWALEDTLRRDLTDNERRALIRAVFKAILSKK